MAATPVEIDHGVIGLTGITLKLYPFGTDSIVNGEGDAMSPRTNRTWVYFGTVDEALSGLHEAVMVDSNGNVLYKGVVDLHDTTSVHKVVEPCHVVSTSSSGTGARTVAVTVNDGTDPLESATVRLSKGSESYTLATDVNGQCTFNVDDGSWVMAVTLSGYSYSGSTVTVDGNETVTASMSQISVTLPTTPGQITGYAICYDEDGAPKSGVTLTIRQVASSSASGYAFDSSEKTETSGVTGLVEFTGMWHGATYSLRRSTGEWVDVRVPTSGDSFELPVSIGP